MSKGAEDAAFMGRAIELANGVRLVAPPNPWVGALVVRDGVVSGEGASAPPGGPHAEVMALSLAGERARGATCYVTLEPCCHTGRTPPCTDALIEAGIVRVVLGIQDPDHRVDGAGIARLREAGVIVDMG